MTEDKPIYMAYGDDGGKFLIGPAGLEAYGPDILKPPHLVKLPPKPDPQPFTDEELATLERVAQQEPAVIDDDGIGYIPVPALVITDLIAEVRRLRVENASLSDRYYDYDPSE